MKWRLTPHWGVMVVASRTRPDSSGAPATAGDFAFLTFLSGDSISKFESFPYFVRILSSRFWVALLV